MKIYSWLSYEENMEMNRRENPEVYEVLNETLQTVKEVEATTPKESSDE